MAGVPEGPEAEMLAPNLAYQEGFGRVFLVCAAGRTGERMRDAPRERLGDTPEQERGIVRDEPGETNRIRPARLAAVEED
ncbi:hypothetical protein KYY02_10175 [Streptomyces pimonensis]|uniref:Oxo-4-hydroxy-4-carboxy-5-ureidoimidazoline decarboxylase domain-containing protein n=1 Tax=Streptomyces pimonensis TaxID=2860288 RepID=A0ABV4IZ68_9ACTN